MMVLISVQGVGDVDVMLNGGIYELFVYVAVAIAIAIASFVIS